MESQRKLDMTEHTHNSNHKKDRIIMCYEVPSSDITVDKCVNQHVVSVNLAQCRVLSEVYFNFRKNVLREIRRKVGRFWSATSLAWGEE